MVLNQNETKSEQPKVSGEGHASRPKLSTTPGTSAFTLTELLVVIAIIAVLAALATNAAINALNAGKRTAILLEIDGLATAIENFKIDYGSYPPNGMNPGGITLAVNDYVRMFKKAFPRHQEPQELIEVFAGGLGRGPFNVQPPAEGGGLTSAEAINFWLGGFSKDPKYPISGPGGPSFANPDRSGAPNPSDEVLEERNGDGKIKLEQLGPRTDTGMFDESPGKGRYVLYDDPRDTSVRRRINLWLYIPSNSSLPVAYFDTSRHKPIDYDQPLSGVAGGNIFAVKKYREGFNTSESPLATDIAFANNGKFQILHCGLDDFWGDQFSQFSLFGQGPINVLKYPEGPFIGDIADTLTNFASGTLEDAQE